MHENYKMEERIIKTLLRIILSAKTTRNSSASYFTTKIKKRQTLL